MSTLPIGVFDMLIVEVTANHILSVRKKDKNEENEEVEALV